MSKDIIYRQDAIDVARKCSVKEVTPAYMLINKAEVMTELVTLPPAQPDRSLWFRIGETCVAESKGFMSAERAVEKIRELLREGW